MKIWFQNRRMKWKRSKKANADSKKESRQKESKETSNDDRSRETPSSGSLGGNSTTPTPQIDSLRSPHDPHSDSEDEIDVQDTPSPIPSNCKNIANLESQPTADSLNRDQIRHRNISSNTPQSGENHQQSLGTGGTTNTFEPLYPPTLVAPVVTSSGGGNLVSTPSVFAGQYQHLPLTATLLTKLPPEAEHLYRPYVS